MKTAAIWILSLAILLACIATQAHGQTIPDAELDKISREDIVATLRHLQTIAKEAQTRADEAEAHEAKTLGALQEMTRQNTALETSIVTIKKTSADVERDRDKKAEIAAKATARADKAEKGEAKQTGLAWKWRLFCFGTWAVVIALFVFRSYLKTIPGVGLLFR